jgi:hypothetical protein
MRALGIVQESDPILTLPARPFALPEEAEDARRVVAELQATAERVAEVHIFGKGLGIAAPQIGIDRAAAIVRPPGGDTITLLNPRIVEESAQIDEQSARLQASLCGSPPDCQVLTAEALGIDWREEPAPLGNDFAWHLGHKGPM